MRNNINRLWVLIVFLALFCPTAFVLGEEEQLPGITNPLAGAGITDLQGFITKVIGFLLGLVGLLALLALIWGGFQYIIAFGDEKKVEHGKSIIKWAIAGLIIIGLAYVIISVVRDLLGGI